MNYIYALHDPSDFSETIYVGKTNDLRGRLKEHLHEMRVSKKNTQKLAWLRSLDARNVKPAIHVIEELHPEHDWKTREEFLIAYFVASGTSLCNSTKGGDGAVLYGEMNGMFGKPSAMRGKVGYWHGKVGPLAGVTGSAHPAFGTVSPMRGRYGENHPAFGKQKSEETKRRLSVSHKGNSGFKGKQPVICLDDSRQFASIADAARYYVVPAYEITCCQGKRDVTRAGWTFRYLEKK